MYTLPDDAASSLSQLLEMWHGISANRLPNKHDMQFDALVSDHPGLFVVKQTDQGWAEVDFEILNAGPELIRHNNRMMIGSLVSEVLSVSTFSYVPEIFQNCLNNGEPHYWEIMIREYGEPPFQYQRLALPLFDEQGVGTSILGSCVYFDA
ncbi:MAG: hypothetical protein ABJ327_21670 [Litoreibacter sp.]